MLDAALLLLKLSEAAGWTKDSMKRQEEDDGCKDADSDNYVPSNEDEKSMPLVPFLRRLDGIATPETPYVGTQKSVITSNFCLTKPAFYIAFKYKE